MPTYGFSVLLLVSAAPKVLAEIKSAIYTAFCAFILRLKLSHNTIKNKVYCDLAITLYYFSNKEIKRIDRPEVTGKAKKGVGAPAPSPIEMPPMIKRMTTKPIV